MEARCPDRGISLHDLPWSDSVFSVQSKVQGLVSQGSAQIALSRGTRRRWIGSRLRVLV